MSGARVFDVRLNDTTVANNYDVRAVAGALSKATLLEFPVTVSGGVGLAVDLVNETINGAILSGLEIFAANPLGVADPRVDLQYSPDGSVWTPLASNLSMDRFGRGSFAWSIPALIAEGSDYRIRAVHTCKRQCF